MNQNLCSFALDAGGKLIPLIISSKDSARTGLCNPSIYNDCGQLIGNLRNVNYVLYHSESERCNHYNGPLTYLHPENDNHLRTTNFFMRIESDSFEISSHSEIDFSVFDSKYTQMWDFRGLEDARIFIWDEKLYVCGVRRDTTPTGIGRMELCEIVEQVLPDGEVNVVEVDRHRIPAPDGDDSYCEKNWMPVLDMPYHFVKWSNPLELVKYNPDTNTTEVVEALMYPDQPVDMRGGSQVIRYENYRIACVHVTKLMQNRLGQKDATYRHRFFVWDLDWNLVGISDEFSFMDGRVEFCAGLAHHGDNFLLTFGFQDNAAYLLCVDRDEVLYKLINWIS